MICLIKKNNFVINASLSSLKKKEMEREYLITNKRVFLLIFLPKLVLI